MERTCLTSLIPRPAACLSVFSAAIAQAQTSPADAAVACVNRGNAWIAQSDPGRAITDCTIAIAFDPTAATACYHRGGIRLTKGDLRRAPADFNQAIQRTPDLAVAFRRRGLLPRLAHDH